MHGSSSALRLLAFVWLVVFAALSPPALALGVVSVRSTADAFAKAETSLPRDLAGRTLVVVNTPDAMFLCAQVPVRLRALGLPSPDRIRCLGASVRPVRVTREDARTIVLVAEGGYLDGPFDRLIRRPEDPLGMGAERALSDVTFTVRRVTEDGRRAEVAVRFAAAIPSPDQVWVSWGEGGYEPFALPAEGESVTARSESLLRVFAP